MALDPIVAVMTIKTVDHLDVSEGPGDHTR